MTAIPSAVRSRMENERRTNETAADTTSQAAPELDLSHLSGAEMAELLDAIPGASGRIEAGIDDARHGRVAPLPSDDDE
jgi:hypothetical protein